MVHVRCVHVSVALPFIIYDLCYGIVPSKLPMLKFVGADSSTLFMDHE